MINVIQGIEGDDLLWHLKLLGANELPKNVYFIPLVNHYNLHNADWFNNVRNQAKNFDTVVFYDLVHIGDYEQIIFKKVVSEFEHPNKIYLTVNQNKSFQIDSVKIIRWDFMWNRYKAYYTESVPTNLHLHHYSHGNYHTIDINYHLTRNKKFMSPMGREYGLRTRLYDIVKNHDGYISNRSKGITFENEPVMASLIPYPTNFTTILILVYMLKVTAAIANLYI